MVYLTNNKRRYTNIRDRGRTDFLDVADTPQLPQHRVQLVNWSETSHKNARLLWYLALPFTLTNVAAYMETTETTKAAELGNSCLRFVKNLNALVLTALATAWLITLADTAMTVWPKGPLSAHRIAAAVVVGLLVAGMLTRFFFRRANTTGVPTMLAHVALAAAAGACAVAFVPASQGAGRLLTRLGFARMVEAVSPFEPDFVTRRVDIMALLCAVSVVTCLIGSAALLIFSGASHVAISSESRKRIADGQKADALNTHKADPRDPHFRGDSQRRDTSLAGAALLLGVAPVLLCAIGATVRTLVGWGVAYVDFLWSILIPPDFGGRIEPSKKPDVLVLQPANVPQLNGHYTIDLIGITALASMAVFVTVLLIVSVVSPRGPRTYTDMPVRPDSRVPDKVGDAHETYVHRFIATLSATVPVAWWLTAAVAATVTAGAIIVQQQGLADAYHWRAFADVLAVDLVVLVAVIVAVGGLGRLRLWISFTADLAGFWPVRVHPLAGTSYREGVTQTLRTYLDELLAAGGSEGGGHDRVVLVGHSQGSVICAWFINSLAQQPLKREVPIHLVTCGSPLRSLYARLFPSDFDLKFFDQVALQAATWDNFWRTTDPIANTVRPLLSGGVRATTKTLDAPHQVVDHWLSDPPLVGRRRAGHGDYWIAPAQRAAVRERLSNSRPPTSPCQEARRGGRSCIADGGVPVSPRSDICGSNGFATEIDRSDS